MPVSLYSVAEDALGGSGDNTEQFIITADSAAFTYTIQDVAIHVNNVKETGQFSVDLKAANFVKSLNESFSAGSFTTTGKDIDFGFGVTAVAGTFTTTGQSVDLNKALIRAANQGSFTTAGQTASFVLSKTLTAASQAFTLSGQTLVFNVSMFADNGESSDAVLDVTGQAANFTRNIPMSANVGTFAYNFEDVDVHLTNVKDTGVFFASFKAANLVKSLNVDAGQASFASTGSAASFNITLGLTNNQGNFGFDFTEPPIAFAVNAPFTQGSFTLTGQAALKRVSQLGESLSLNINGQDASFNATMLGDKGLFSTVSQVFDIDIVEVIPSVSFALAGQDASFSLLRGAAPGTFSLTGQAAVFNASMSSDEVSLTTTGQDAVFTTSRVSGSASVSLTGQAAFFNALMSSNAGTFSVAGQDALKAISEIGGDLPFVFTGQAASFEITMPVSHSSFATTSQSFQIHLTKLFASYAAALEAGTAGFEAKANTDLTATSTSISNSPLDFDAKANITTGSINVTTNVVDVTAFLEVGTAVELTSLSALLNLNLDAPANNVFDYDAHADSFNRTRTVYVLPEGGYGLTKTVHVEPENFTLTLPSYQLGLENKVHVLPQDFTVYVQEHKDVSTTVLITQ